MNIHATFTIVVAAIAVFSLAGCSGGPVQSDATRDDGLDIVADAHSDDGADGAGDIDARLEGDDFAETADDLPDDSSDDGFDDDPLDSGEVPGDAADDDAVDAVTPPLWEDIAPTGPNTVRATIGVSTHMHQGPGDNAERNFEFEKYVELGGATIREDFHWDGIEPADDQWNMDHVKGQMDMAISRGIEVIPMFGYENDWAQTDGASSIDMAEYGEYVGHVAGQYCQNINIFEIWNEENIPRFWSGKPDAEAYGRMLKAAHQAITGACPEARVAFGGIASYDAETDLADRYGFLKRVAAAHPDICEYFEVVAFHPYTFMQYDPPERDVIIDDTLAFQGQSWQTAILKGILDEIGCPDKSVIITEQGWPSYDLTEQQVGLFLPRSILLAIRDGVEKYMWYTFWDGYPTTEGVRPHESYFGLFGWTGGDGTVRRAKPAWTALKALADNLGEMRFARDVSTAIELPNDVYALAFMDDRGRLTVAAWDGRDFPDTSWGVDGPGGEDTSHELLLPLPELYDGLAVYDIEGNLLTEGIDYQVTYGETTTVTILLTPSVVYIKAFVLV